MPAKCSDVRLRGMHSAYICFCLLFSIRFPAPDPIGQLADFDEPNVINAEILNSRRYILSASFGAFYFKN